MPWLTFVNLTLCGSTHRMMPMTFPESKRGNAFQTSSPRVHLGLADCAKPLDRRGLFQSKKSSRKRVYYAECEQKISNKISRKFCSVHPRGLFQLEPDRLPHGAQPRPLFDAATGEIDGCQARQVGRATVQNVTGELRSKVNRFLV